MLINDVTYAIPYSVQWYNRIKMKYLNYSHIFNYPHVKLISFDDKRRILLIERINGSVFNDIKHHKQIIQKMIEYAIEASPMIDNKRYLQHGDINPSNIIWKNDRDPIFIDIDNIDYHPILFDIIHYAASCITTKQLVSILDENAALIGRLFDKYEMQYNRHFLDYAFAEYI